MSKLFLARLASCTFLRRSYKSLCSHKSPYLTQFHPERHQFETSTYKPCTSVTSRPLCADAGKADDRIIKSPLPDVDIPDNVSLTQYMLGFLMKHQKLVAFEDSFTKQTKTYGELHHDIVHLASSLVHQGIKKGDTVVLFAPNCIDYSTVYLAVTATGATICPVIPLYTKGELISRVNLVCAKMIFTVPELLPLVTQSLPLCKSKPSIVSMNKDGISPGVIPMENLLHNDGSLYPHDLELDYRRDVAVLPFSNGTTGHANGVMLTHYNMIANIEQITAPGMLEYIPGDVFLGLLPYFHIYGQSVMLLAGLKCGCKNVIMNDFQPDIFLQNVQNYKVTYLHTVPSIVNLLARHPAVERFDLHSLRSCLTGSAPVNDEMIEHAVHRIGVPELTFRQEYGVTEASPITHMHINDLEEINYQSVGIAVPNTQYKVADIVDGTSLGPNKEGEICIQGPNIMKGYFKNQKNTRNALRDGWLHTGDIGYYDEKGHAFITDRLKQLLKVKGYQVVPAELESCLMRHPAVQDCAVLGKPDTVHGELPMALVVLKHGVHVYPEDLQQFMKGKIAPYKELKGGVEFRDEIPRDSNGLIERRKLKEQLNAKLRRR